MDPNKYPIAKYRLWELEKSPLIQEIRAALWQVEGPHKRFHTTIHGVDIDRHIGHIYSDINARYEDEIEVFSHLKQHHPRISISAVARFEKFCELSGWLLNLHDGNKFQVIVKSEEYFRFPSQHV